MKEHDLVPIASADLSRLAAEYVERARLFAESENDDRRAYVVPKMRARGFFGLFRPVWRHDREPTDAEILHYGDTFWPTYWPGRSFYEYAKVFQTRMHDMIKIADGKEILLTSASASELARDPFKCSDPLLRW